MTEHRPHSVPPEIEKALVELGSEPRARVSIREADELRAYIEGLVEQLEAVRRDARSREAYYEANLRSAEEQLEAVREALLREAFIAERYATPRENAIVTTWADMAGNLRQIAALIPAKQPYVYSGDVNDPGPHPASRPS